LDVSVRLAQRPEGVGRLEGEGVLDQDWLRTPEDRFQIVFGFWFAVRIGNFRFGFRVVVGSRFGFRFRVRIDRARFLGKKIDNVRKNVLKIDLILGIKVSILCQRSFIL
jgi:hypothetical protein